MDRDTDMNIESEIIDILYEEDNNEDNFFDIIVVNKNLTINNDE